MAVLRRGTSALVGVVASALVLTGCAAGSETTTEETTSSSGGGSAETCTTPTVVTMLGTIKVEIQDQFKDAVAEYNSANTDCVEVKIIESAADQTFLANITPLYEAGEAPVIAYTLQELPDMAPRVMDWTGTPLAALAAAGTLDTATIDGKILGIPSTVEAFGLLYNKAVLDEAGVDPAAIKTRADLEAAFQAVEATGRDAIHFSGLWWSLGAHFTNIYHTTAADTREGRLGILDELKAGSYDLLSDPAFVNWLDTFDLLKAYSNDEASIADDDYDKGVFNLADGEAGFWFMGNWAEPSLLGELADGEFGVMPVPTSNNASDYGMDGISVGVPGYFVIDAEQSTEEERAGAQAFLSWFLTTPEGQARWAGPIEAGGMNFIPVYSGFTVAPETFMAGVISDYVNAGKSLQWVNSSYPAGLQENYGAAAQKYYNGVSDRAAFAEELAGAWTK
jgi:raffinose/stachyose/melibiose transport system substrate-binding protein